MYRRVCEIAGGCSSPPTTLHATRPISGSSEAQDLGGEPVARVGLPHPVPYGFHGNWVPA